jgi:hypothetical protein
MSDDDFYVRQDRARMFASMRSAVSKGEQLTREQLVALYADEAESVCNRILARVRGKGSADARLSETIRQLVMEIMAISVSNVQKRDALEKRIVELERVAKAPPLRVVGGN